MSRVAGISPETVSRAKKRANVDLQTLNALAESSGVELKIAPQKSTLGRPSLGLIWSNSKAPADMLVRKALTKGAFVTIVEQGYPAVLEEFQALKAEDVITPAVAANVERMLHNIKQGISLAS